MISIVVLGAAAGGGFPQWNSNAENCRRARAGEAACPVQTQASLAVSGDGQAWTILNASPDIGRQILAAPVLHPKGADRSSPIASVILTSGEVDAIAGLLTLRERQPFTLFASERVLSILAANPIFDVLQRDIVQRQSVLAGARFVLPCGLQATLFAVPGKVPLYLERGTASAASEDDVFGVELSDGHRRALFIPGCASIDDSLRARLRDADLLFFDGTLWEDDEMIQRGLGPKTGRRMGHMPVYGKGGTLDSLADLPIARKILIHINNSNPILDRSSAEHAAVRAAGWDVAHDGMEITA